MKKSLLIIVIFMIFLLTSCINTQKVPLGKIPSEKFIIGEYINDNAIYQASSDLIINGNSEPGVIIVARLYDNKGNIDALAYSDTDKKGNWSLKLSTPDASFTEYSLKISDSTDKYHEYYNNIRFGESWLITGDKLINKTLETDDNTNDNIEKTLNESLNYDNMFYYNGHWVPASMNYSTFGYEIINSIKASFKTWNKYPISIVFATSENSSIYEWLSRDLIDSRRIVKDALVKNNLYLSIDEKVNPSDMTYCYEQYISKIKGMSFSNIVVNHGLKDLDNANNNIFYNDNNFSELYFQMLYNYVDQLESIFVIEEKVMIIEAQSGHLNNLEKLRLIQSNVCNIYNKCEIIPTYDLSIVYDFVKKEYINQNNEYEAESYDDLEVLGIDFIKLADRVYKVSNNIIKIPTIANCVQIYDENKDVIQIKLIFDNINSFKVDDKLIGFEVYDSEGKVIEEIKYEFINNEIIIDLEKNVSNPDIKDDSLTIDDSSNGEISESKYYDVLRICYAFDNFNYFCNLRSEMIVIDPFEIILKK